MIEQCGAIVDLAKASGILTDNSKAGIAASKKEDWVNKRTDLWTQIDKNIFPYLASCKSYESSITELNYS